MAVEDSEKTPYAGKIPISPVMDSQFDQIVIQCILNPLRTQVLKGLEAKVNRTKREDWFETYLLVFLLLNNIELSTAHDHKFANLHHHVVCKFVSASLIHVLNLSHRRLAGARALKTTASLRHTSTAHRF